MKRYAVVLICAILAFSFGVVVLGNNNFYSEIKGEYLILLPDEKSNQDLEKGLSGEVYLDSSLKTRGGASNLAGTGKYFKISDKKYEIIVKGDTDGDGLILASDVLATKDSFKKSQYTEREKLIFDIDGNGKVSVVDYIIQKAHFQGFKKIVNKYVPDNSSQESVDPDWTNQCQINLSDGNTRIEGSGASVSANVITITAGGEYTVKGKLSDGCIIVNSSEKVKIRLNGADITNKNGPSILFKNADKGYITINNASVNRLTDGNSYTNGKGVIHSEADLEIKGKGTLYLTANYRHAISCDEDLTIENGIILVEKAPKDGIHAKNSVEISGGEITLKNCLGDGIDCEGNSSGLKGTVSITGGKITMSSISGDGINALGKVEMNNGTLSITSAEDCIKSDEDVYVSSSAYFVLNAGSDGINSKKSIFLSGGSGKITATEYTLKADLNITVSKGSFEFDGKTEKIYALGNINITQGTLK